MGIAGQPPGGRQALTDLPVRLTVQEDLQRNRLTVFFRLLLAIPHFVWLWIWGIGVFFLVIVSWFVLLFKGELSGGLHRFLTSYIRYATHVYAYISVAANPYPGFTGDPGYDVDVDFDPPQPQNRLTVAFRVILAIPVFILAGAVTGSGWAGSTGETTGTSGDGAEFSSAGVQFVGVLAAAGLIAWFYSLFKGRAPEGTTRLLWYSLHYGALAWSYILLVTDRYPNADPTVVGVPRSPPPHPIRLREEEDSLERSRLTVFFRLPLFIPHLFWLMLWSIAAFVVVFLSWFAILFTGRMPEAFHRFLSAYLRYYTHVTAFVLLIANPFPGFTGAEGSYPVSLDVAPRERQNRLVTAFRIVLAIPAFIIQSGTGTAIYAAAFLGWFAALFTGRMPRQLRNLGAFGLRYAAQTTAYTSLLTDRYPYAGPPAGAVAEPEPEPDPEPEADPAPVWNPVSQPEPGI